MALFKKSAPVPAWSPHVDLTTAGPLVLALAHGPATTDQQMRSAIDRLVAVSDAPMDMMAMVQQINKEPNIAQRPWIWLLEAQRAASATGNHHVSAAALLWASYFTGVIVPKYPRPTEVWGDTHLDLVPSQLKPELLALGLASARALPPGFVIAGDDTGAVTAESLAVVAPQWLGS